KSQLYPKLCELASKNEVEPILTTGQPFGRLLRFMDRFEEEVAEFGGALHQEYFEHASLDDHEWQALSGSAERITKEADRLLGLPFVRQSIHAASKLREIRDRPQKFVTQWGYSMPEPGKWVREPAPYETSMAEALRDSRRAQCATFLAIGDILGNLRD